MGYTHYWRRPQTLDPERFAQWADDVARIIAASGQAVYEEFDTAAPPVISEDLVRFNGPGDLGHETFLVARVYEPRSWQTADEGLYFAFCKTAYKPYDLLVTAALIRLAHHFPEVAVSSDGEAGDWSAAVGLCTKVFGNALLPFGVVNPSAEGW